MKVTEQQIEKWDNVHLKHSKRKKQVIVQCRWDPTIKRTGIYSFMSSFCKDWRNSGKFNTIKDAIKSLESIAKKGDKYNFQYRVFINGEHVFENTFSPEALAVMLTNWKEIKMKAYKASYSGKCKSLIYEVGKTYTFEGTLSLCQKGFHFCRNLENVFDYYPPDKDKKLIVFEIEVLGDIIDDSYQNKSVTNKLKILRIMNEFEYENLIPHENCDEIKKYDKDNNLIYLRDSNGYEEWIEYDVNNNVVHYQDSYRTGWKIVIES